MTQDEALDVLIDYLHMLGCANGHDPIAAEVMTHAFRDWERGEADSDSGVPESDLETRLSRVIEALTEHLRRDPVS